MAARPKGKLGGVPFYKVSHTITGGRRHDVHSLPFEERGAVANDLGRAPRKIEVEALLYGDDHRAQRDDMLAALETPGPTILEHPDWGRLSVYVDPAQLSEAVTASNVTKLRIRATEAFDRPAQPPVLDTASALKATASGGRLAAAQSFANTATGLSGSVSDLVLSSNIEVLDDVLNGLRAMNNFTAAVLAIPGQIAGQIDAIARAIEQAIYLSDPRRLFEALDDVIGTLARAVGRFVDTDGAERDQSDVEDPASLPYRRGRLAQRIVVPAKALGNGVPDVPDIDTEDRDDQRQDQRAIQRHFQAAALLHIAEVVADLLFDSVDDAIDMRDTLTEALAELADSEPDLDAPLADALRDTAALVMSHLSEQAGALGAILEYTPQDTLPAEVIAYALYGDAERADEIVARNASITHPGFVTAKTPIDVANR